MALTPGTRIPEAVAGQLYDVSPDGQRFLMLTSVMPDDASTRGYVLVQNPFDGQP